MSTTAIFAELVVGGLQSLAWLLLLVMVVLGVPASIPTAGSWPVDAGIVLSVAYTFGVLFDRLWDVILSMTRIDQFVRRSNRAIQLTQMDLQRRRIFNRDAAVAAEFVNYNRCRMRVARASMFNFILITVFACILAFQLDQQLGSGAWIVIALVGLGLTGVAIVAYVSLSRTYERCLQVASDYEVMSPSATEQ